MSRLHLTLLVLLLAIVGTTYGSPPPCHCLQELWQEYPGSADLYFSLWYNENCDEDGEEMLWFGTPTNPKLPQECDKDECEEDARFMKAKTLPGHGLSLSSADAWDVMETHFLLAKAKQPNLDWGHPEYHRIPQHEIPEGLELTHDIIVIAVPILVNQTNSPLDGHIRYLCMQIDSADEQEITSTTMIKIRQSTGRQFGLNYSVRGEKRKGLVWLK